MLYRSHHDSGNYNLHFKVYDKFSVVFGQEMERLRKQVNMEDPTMCPHAAEWDNITMETAIHRWLWTQGMYLYAYMGT